MRQDASQDFRNFPGREQRVTETVSRGRLPPPPTFRPTYCVGELVGNELPHEGDGCGSLLSDLGEQEKGRVAPPDTQPEQPC